MGTDVYRLRDHLLKFQRGILSHSCVTWDMSCSTVLGLLCCTVRFMMCQTFLAGDCRQPSSTPRHFYYKTCLCKRCSMQFNIVFLKYIMSSLKKQKRASGGNICFCKTCIKLSVLMVPFDAFRGSPCTQSCYQSVVR